MESELRSVLSPAGNKAPSPCSGVSSNVAGKASPKPNRSERESSEGRKKGPTTTPHSPGLSTSLSLPSAALRRQEILLRSNLSLDASCSSDASTDSFCSRASTGRIRHGSFTARRKKASSQTDRTFGWPGKPAAADGGSAGSMELVGGKKRCAWVTPNTDPCYAAFHDEEWGVPVHDDNKLFELFVMSGALAELPWPEILGKRHMFKEIFLDFDPNLVSQLSERKMLAPGSPASLLLSEPKLRAIVENARQIVKIKDEFGSFERYCWSFVNHKPIISRFRYQRQVPVRTSKADTISKDLVRRGFLSCGPTVVYTFMQAAGLTNDHLVNCHRFAECQQAASLSNRGAENDAAEPAIDADKSTLLKAVDDLSIT